MQRTWIGNAARTGSAIALIAVLVTVLATPATVGCGGDACSSACDNNNRLRCAGTCDCSACSTAPPSCQTFFACAASKNSCLDIGLNCTEPSECATYRLKHCR